MTIDKARELLAVQVEMASGYNRNSVRLILNEISQTEGQTGVDQLIKEFSLDSKFGLELGETIRI